MAAWRSAKFAVVQRYRHEAYREETSIPKFLERFMTLLAAFREKLMMAFA